MFRKSDISSQLNLFTSPKALFSGKSLSLYENASAWHNKFREEVTMRIDENIFRPLYCSNNGTPNAPIRILIAMMILKEAEGLSDQKLFENCRFNMLTRSAIGLFNADDHIPTESTYYLFRKRICDYTKENNENLFDIVFAQITSNQCAEFEVSGKRVRMDSKLLGSNISWLSRYELIHETLRLFYTEIEESNVLPLDTKAELDSILKIKGNKVVYICTSDEVKTRLQKLGELINSILSLFSHSKSASYLTLKKVFEEQYEIAENKIPVARKKEDISAKSIQSPHDTDCHYRNKDGNKIKGYAINVTESCDDGKILNLITNVNVKKVSTSDVDFLQTDVEKSQKVLPDKIEILHTDGAYNSPDNQTFCKTRGIELYLHAIQGAKGRYSFTFLENGELSIFDIISNQPMETIKIITKKGITKWRIRTSKAYRYFTQKDIDTYNIRKKIEETPIEILQKRNNVEATIFQLAYHYPNAKSRYRGEIKHQMWANIRCLWVNFVRILKHITKPIKNGGFFCKIALSSHYIKCLTLLKSLLQTLFPHNIWGVENFQFSAT